MLFIVSSIAGSGKTTLVDYVVKKLNLYKLKTCTTRPIRQEENGTEYHFMNKETFINKIFAEDFIEYAKVYNEYYGLTKEEIEKNKEKNCIIILDVQGTETIKKLYPDAISIFIFPPTLDEIRKRLVSRNTSDFDVDKRIAEMDNELQYVPKYDCFIKYNDLEHMKNQIYNIVRSCLLNHA